LMFPHIVCDPFPKPLCSAHDELCASLTLPYPVNPGAIAGFIK
jgi:hypothetical protein